MRRAIAAVLLVVAGCGTKDNETATITKQAILFYDKDHFLDQSKKQGTKDFHLGTEENWVVLKQGSQVRVIERIPEGARVVVQSAIVTDYAGSNSKDRLTESPSLKGKVGWVFDGQLK